ncbi:MAG: holo-ACP synthase [Pseudomonadota bacterium]
MKPVGSGIDIVEIQRVQEILDKNGQKFYEKILHPLEMKEIEKWSNKTAFIAKRFAVKEAASKALGTGIGKLLSFKDMYVDHDDLGKPILIFTEDCKQRFNLENKHSLLTIADEKDYAVAHVMLFIE